MFYRHVVSIKWVANGSHSVSVCLESYISCLLVFESEFIIKLKKHVSYDILFSIVKKEIPIVYDVSILSK